MKNGGPSDRKTGCSTRRVKFFTGLIGQRTEARGHLQRVVMNEVFRARWSWRVLAFAGVWCKLKACC
jgi:hypothetical protein